MEMDFFIRQLFNGIMLGSIYVLIALGLVLILSMLDVVNFAHGQVAMIGAYGVLFFQNSFALPFWASLLISAAMVAIIGFIIEKGVMRQARIKKLPLLIAGVATVGLGVIIEEALAIMFGKTPISVTESFASQSVDIGILTLSLMRLLIPVFVVVIVAALFVFLYKTKIGRGMRAVAQDNDAASLLGINVDSSLNLGFIISCVLACLAGAFLAQMMPQTPYAGMMMSLKAFAIIVVGGMMSLHGAIIASYALGIGEVMIAGYAGEGYKDMFFFAAMVLILLFKREGLFGSSIR